MFGFKNKDIHDAVLMKEIPQIKSVACFECHMLVSENYAQKFNVFDRDVIGRDGFEIHWGKKGIGFFCPQHKIPNLSKIFIDNGVYTYTKVIPEQFVPINKKGEEIKTKPVKK